MIKITRRQLAKIIRETFEGKPGKWKYGVVSIGKYDDVNSLTPEDIKSVRVKILSGPSNVGKEFPLSDIEGNEGLKAYKSHPLVTQILDSIKNNKGLEGIKIQSPEEMPSSTSSLDGAGFINVTPDMLTAAVPAITNDTATYALSSFRKHFQAGKIKNNHKMVIVDYRIPGNDTRLWCVEINDAGKISLAVSSDVAHGSGDSAKGDSPSSRFSNTPGSNTSSVGSFVTTKRYKSGAGVLYKYASVSDKKNLSKSQLKKKYKGLAMRFQGLDSTNSNDLKRAIVFHGASYRDGGKTGRSHGCLATSREKNEKIINFLGVGSFGYKFGGANNADRIDTSWISSIKEGFKMKITRRQLRKLISEAITAGPEGVHRVPPEDRSPRVPVGRLTKDRFHGTAPKSHHVSPQVADIFDLDDPDQQEQAYDLSDTMQDYMPGTAQTARDDMKYSKQASELALSPMYEVLKDIILPNGYKDFEFKSIDKYVADDEGYNDFDTIYDYVTLQNPSGDREIEFTLETPYNSKTPNPHIGIRVYKIESDEEFGFMRSMMDYAPVLFGMEKPEEIKRKLDKLIQRMK